MMTIKSERGSVFVGVVVIVVLLAAAVTKMRDGDQEAAVTGTPEAGSSAERQ
ncbi:MAG: hypothetical protein ACE5EM_12630 [Sphingomonadales bacterium]